MEEKRIETRLVQGFMDAGKTTFIQDCILNDYFHKYGNTLILCFEEGEKEYDLEALSERRTTVAYYDGDEDVSAFCHRMIDMHQPDRIYVEMNAMMQGLREALVPVMNITYVSVWIEWKTLDLYVRNLQQLMNQMVSEAHQVTFRGCPSKELLTPYSQLFRLMNHKASYLRQDPMGYHEKAFDLFVPWSLDDNEITVTIDTYLLFWLDAADHPEHYDGKKICFTNPLQVRRTLEADCGPKFEAGRVVMTCCMADLQFMGFPVTDANSSVQPSLSASQSTGENSASGSLNQTSTRIADSQRRIAGAEKNRPESKNTASCPEQTCSESENCCLDTGWFLIHAIAECKTGEYSRRSLVLHPYHLERTPAPAQLILSAQSS